MELRDLIVTPIWLFIIYAVAYRIRPFVTDSITRRYFFPALTVKIIGALAVGFIYQFYYGGGDTFNFHTHGSRPMWEAFWDSPEKGLKLFFYGGADLIGVYQYASRIFFINDESSFAVIRLAFLFDLLTFSSYSATAILFAALSFVGMGLFFLVFCKQYPHLHKLLAFCSFFIPSVFFWGSGLLKDTVTLTCLGVAVFAVHALFVERRFGIGYILILCISLFTMYKVKIYILLMFLPSVVIWIFMSNLQRIRVKLVRVMLFPPVIASAVVLGYFAMVEAGKDNTKYSLDKIGETAKVTAYDIRYWTGRDAGSGYTLGELDGSLASMVKLAPQAINVSLFRPYIWEVRNPLMLLSALESLAFLLLVLYLIFFRFRLKTLNAVGDRNVLFLLVFSIAFAFAVGVSTFNFGTLVRYKIPLLPMFATALVLIYDFSKSERKLFVLASTE